MEEELTRTTLDIITLGGGYTPIDPELTLRNKPEERKARWIQGGVVCSSTTLYFLVRNRISQAGRRRRA